MAISLAMDIQQFQARSLLSHNHYCTNRVYDIYMTISQVF